MNTTSEKGFTLLEAIISMAIFLLVLVAVLTIYDSARRAYTRGDRRADIQMNARVALAQMSREIRMAGYFPEAFATPPTTLTGPIRIATNNAIAIYGDADDDGTSCATMYCLDGTNLRRTNAAVGTSSTYVCTSGDIIASKVTGLQFTYYDASNNPVPSPPTTPYQLDSISPGSVPSMATTTQRDQVRRVVITLTTSASGQADKSGLPYTLVSDVWRRNG